MSCQDTLPYNNPVRKINLRLFFFSLLFFINASTFAQWGPAYEAIKINVYPDRHNWTYEVGDQVDFQVLVLYYGSPVADDSITYSVGLERLPATLVSSMKLKQGRAVINGGTLNKPGFLRCTVNFNLNGRTYSGLATAAFSPEKIKPTTELPEDFDTFWGEAIAAQSLIPMDPKVELLPDLSDEQINVYQVSLQNFRLGSRVYGVLSVPRNKQKMPAILKVPGAGVWPAFMAQDADAKKGVITFEIRIHGVPAVSEESRMYNDLWNSAAFEYWNSNLDDKNRYYYKRVFMGCIRAVDYIFSRPEFDGKRLAVSGGSQGGPLSIVTAALDKRVNYLVCYYPAMCDHTGYLHGRAGGWPHLFQEQNQSFNNKPDKIETSKYYDVVNFARKITVPGYYAWGYNDDACPPTSMFAAYNVITAEKYLNIAPVAGHYDFPEQKMVTNAWLFSQLLPSKN